MRQGAGTHETHQHDYAAYDSKLKKKKINYVCQKKNQRLLWRLKRKKKKTSMNIVVLQAAGVPHSERWFRCLQMVRRSITITYTLVQTQV